MTDQGRLDFYVVSTRSLCPIKIKININKFAISSHTALKLAIEAQRSYLKLTCEYELDILPTQKLVPQRMMVETT